MTLDQRNSEISAMRASGMKLRAIGELYGLTHQRIQQIATPKPARPRPRKGHKPCQPWFEGPYQKAIDLANTTTMSSREIANQVGHLEFVVCRWLGRDYVGYSPEEHQGQTLEIEPTGPPPADYTVRLKKGNPRPCVVCGRKTAIRVGWPGYEQEGDPVDDGCRLAYERQWGLYV